MEVKGSNSIILSCVMESKRQGDKRNTWIWTEGSGLFLATVTTPWTPGPGGCLSGGARLWLT